MTLNGVTDVTLHYFTEFGKPAFQHITASERKKESSRSLISSAGELLISMTYCYQQMHTSIQIYVLCILYCFINTILAV